MGFTYTFDIDVTTPALDLEIFYCGLQPNAWLMHGNDGEIFYQWHRLPFDGTTGVEFLSDRVRVHLVDDERGDQELFPGRIQFTGSFVMLGDTPLRIHELSRRPGNNWFLRFTGPGGFEWQIQETTDFSNWTTILSTNVNSVEPSVLLPASVASPRLFRILSTPAP